MDMRKSMSRNPNMLRTMIGTGLTLVLVLAYAVYSNTVDTEYYGYATTNTEIELDLQENEEGKADWFVTTQSGITWLNLSFNGLQDGMTVRIDASGTEWYYSPLLGSPDADNFNCGEQTTEVSETCEYSSLHESEVESDSHQMRGIVSLKLPIDGLGYLQSEDQTSAELAALELMSDENKTVTWRITVLQDGSTVDSTGIESTMNIVTHDLISVEAFELDPIQESVYSFATLVGCFAFLLFLPLLVYFSAKRKHAIDEQKRKDAPEPEQ
tara:strand:+ start:1511 stop:2317 length:807 start_codon:yes stop_codon:yes gene_type:complete